MTEETALAQAIRIVGGKSALAAAISTPAKPVSAQTIGQWKKCPAERVLAVEAAVMRAKERLRNAPTRHQLRPDIYPPKGQSPHG